MSGIFSPLNWDFDLNLNTSIKYFFEIPFRKTFHTNSHVFFYLFFATLHFKGSIIIGNGCEIGAIYKREKTACPAKQKTTKVFLIRLVLTITLIAIKIFYWLAIITIISPDFFQVSFLWLRTILLSPGSAFGKNIFMYKCNIRYNATVVNIAARKLAC